MALKLPWKYKSLVAVINSYRESEGDINNFAVTGSFESFHPLTFFISSPLPRGREAGQWREGGWYRQLLNFTFLNNPSFFFFLTWLLLSFPFHLFLLSLFLHLSLYSAANPLRLPLRFKSTDVPLMPAFVGTSFWTSIDLLSRYHLSLPLSFIFLSWPTGPQGDFLSLLVWPFI